MTATVCCEFSRMLSTVFLIISVSLLDCSANFLTSSATTANPLPCSPARAASILAFKANRLVCSVMLWIEAMI